jgi:hypothetical protein
MCKTVKAKAPATASFFNRHLKYSVVDFDFDFWKWDRIMRVSIMLVAERC